MKPVSIESLAAKLNCDLSLAFSPLAEDPEDRDKTIRNPKPWTCRKIDYMAERGHGTTPDEACGALVEAMIITARRHLADETDAQKRATAHLEELVNLLAVA